MKLCTIWISLQQASSEMWPESLFKRSVGGQVTGSLPPLQLLSSLLSLQPYAKLNHAILPSHSPSVMLPRRSRYPKHCNHSTHMCRLTTRCYDLQPSYATYHNHLVSPPTSQHQNVAAHKDFAIYPIRCCSIWGLLWTMRCSTWRRYNCAAPAQLHGSCAAHVQLRYAVHALTVRLCHKFSI